MARRGALLVSAPFSALHYPSMALSLLKPCLRAAGIACDVRYLTFDFADRVGHEVQEHLTDGRYYQALVGEWLFADLAHGVGEGVGERAGEGGGLAYLTEVFARHYPDHHAPDRLMAFLRAREAAAAFVEAALETVDWGAYGLVGFTTSFQQNLAALALARRVKARWPHLAVVFGGANCRGDMGLALHAHYPFLDAVCLDESERSFPELARRLLDGAPATGIPGVAARGPGGESVPPRVASTPVRALDELPYPDFTDFYAQHARSPVARRHYPPAALFETSRGCWWGAKHHCTFCGINGEAMAYRAKSPARAYDELVHIVARHGADVVSVDAILDPRYFGEFLPRLAREGPAITAYFEVKVNLRPEQIRMLAAAGIAKIQPGIESLDSAILAAMRKGATLLQNLQTLRLAAEAGLFVEWNLLHGFPGEDPAAYARMAALVPDLVHLHPPASVGRVRADRFSPYHADPAAFGIAVEPAPAYRHLYPFGEAAVRRLAYHFDIHPVAGAPGADPDFGYVRPVIEACAAWRAGVGRRGFAWTDLGDAAVLVDERRDGGPRTTRLGALPAAILRRCGTAQSRAGLRRALSDDWDGAAIEAACDDLVAARALVAEGDLVLRLPLAQPGPRAAAPWQEVRQAVRRGAARIAHGTAPPSLECEATP